MLNQAGFTCEFVNLTNKHRACQCILVHVVFKTRREELQQMRDGLDSVSLLQFLQISESCVKFVFPLQSEVKVQLPDFLRKIDATWLSTLDGVHQTVVKWFTQYVTEIFQSNSGNVRPICIILHSFANNFQT